MVVARVSPPDGDSRLSYTWLVCELKQHVEAFSPVDALPIEVMLHSVSAVRCVARLVVALVSPTV